MANYGDFIPRTWYIPRGLKGTFQDFVVTCDILMEEEEDSDSEQRHRNPVMICGPTGAGKSLFVQCYLSRFIKRRGEKGELSEKDKGGNIRKVNCAAYSETLIESELFGHEKGAFSGAVKTKRGIFEIANDGVLILEEVGELTQQLQAKLLTVMEDGQFYRVGGEKSYKTNVRIIATTNRERESFRDDFWYRFNHFHVPPLHKRRIDVLYYLAILFPEVFKDLTQGMALALMAYHWPGNVRELERMKHVIRLNTKKYAKTAFWSYSNEEIESKEIAPEKLLGKRQESMGLDLDKLNNLISFLSQETLSELESKLKAFYISTEPYNQKLLKDKSEDELISASKAFEEDDQFIYIKSDILDVCFTGFIYFCYLLFLNHQSEKDLLDIEDLQLSKMNLGSILKTDYKYSLNKKLAMNIFKEMFKVENTGKTNQLPFDDTRKSVIQKIARQNPDNKALRELIGEKVEVGRDSAAREIDIKDVTQEELIGFYYETLFYVTEGNQTKMKEIAGHTSSSSVSTQLRKLKESGMFDKSKDVAKKRIIILK
jgi:transcriptional regulator with AAA-type ATPase domain